MSELYMFIAKLLIQFAKSEMLKDITASDMQRSQIKRRLLSAARYMMQHIDMLDEIWTIKGIFQLLYYELKTNDYYGYLVWIEREITDYASRLSMSENDQRRYRELLRDIQQEKEKVKQELIRKGEDIQNIPIWKPADLRPLKEGEETQIEFEKQYPTRTFHSKPKDVGYHYLRPQSSYSGTDMVCTINIPGKGPIVFGELSSISYSIYREKVPVRSLGRISMKGYTRGMRTISGILTFTVFDESIVYRCMEELRKQGYRILMDEMPLFDITITMANEYGSQSMLTLYGVTTYTEGKVMSVDEIMTQNVYEFYALDIDPLSKIATKHQFI
jgi:hypothetical protein